MRATTMSDERGRQYHIGLEPGELAPNVLVCGDPARAERFADAHLSAVRVERRSREYVTFTGLLGALETSVMSTGMGADNMEIAMIEMAALQPVGTVIRMGSCGGLQSRTEPGDLVVSTAAVRLETTTTAYVPPGFPAVADIDLILALRQACVSLEVPHHVGITATAAGFYGAQGRSVGPFRSLHGPVLEQLTACGVLNLEMECSALFTLASLAGWRAGAVCAVYANRLHDTALDHAGRREAEARCMAVAARALEASSTGRPGGR